MSGISEDKFRVNTGIYEIVNTTNGNRYVGSAVNFNDRWRDHRKLLRSGAHHTRHLQRAWAKHGEGAFEFRRLLVCAKENLLMYEQRAIDALLPEYNISRTAGSSLGVKHTPEARSNMSAAHKGCVGLRKGKSHSPEARAKISAAGIGRKHSIETRAKMSAAHAGRIHTPEARANMSKGQMGNKKALGFKNALGYRHTAETLAKMASHKPSPEHRAKISIALRGRKRTPEQRANLVRAWVKRKQEKQNGPVIS